MRSNLAQEEEMSAILTTVRPPEEPYWDLIRAAAAQYEATATWLDFDEYMFDREHQGKSLDWQVRYQIPGELGCVEHGNMITLTTYGLLRSGVAPRTSEVAASLVALCVRLLRIQRKEAKISPSVIVAELGEDPYTLERAEYLLTGLSVLGGGAGGDSWCREINPTTLDYREVQTAADLLTLLKIKGAERVMAARSAFPATVAPVFGSVFAESYGPSLPRTSPAHAPPEVADLHPVIADEVADRVSAGQFGDAVFAAAKAFVVHLRWKAALPDDLDGTPLVEQAFARLRFRDDMGMSTRSVANRLRGVGEIAHGMILAYRHVGAHQREKMDPAEAIEALGTFSLLCRIVDQLATDDS